MMVPKMIATINTANKKTDILARLAFNAETKVFEAPKYLPNFNILNTLKRRNALKATNAWVPENNIERS